jgi:hypothetical protein
LLPLHSDVIGTTIKFGHRDLLNKANDCRPSTRLKFELKVRAELRNTNDKKMANKSAVLSCPLTLTTLNSISLYTG